MISAMKKKKKKKLTVSVLKAMAKLKLTLVHEVQCFTAIYLLLHKVTSATALKINK